MKPPEPDLLALGVAKNRHKSNKEGENETINTFSKYLPSYTTKLNLIIEVTLLIMFKSLRSYHGPLIVGL